MDEGFPPEQGELEQRGDDFDDSGFVRTISARDETHLFDRDMHRDSLAVDENMEMEYEQAALGSRSK